MALWLILNEIWKSKKEIPERMTTEGGSNGVVFQIRTDGTGFQVLHRFAGSDGGKPVGSLILFGATLYGMTMNGGNHGNGVVFALDLPSTSEKAKPSAARSRRLQETTDDTTTT
jgi:uncharacterized repeat protein (TIGR03803 family)